MTDLSITASTGKYERDSAQNPSPARVDRFPMPGLYSVVHAEWASFGYACRLRAEYPDHAPTFSAFVVCDPMLKLDSGTRVYLVRLRCGESLVYRAS